MIMFLSSFFGIIDSKNRIAIPSSYRATIKETKEKVYLFKSLKYPMLGNSSSFKDQFAC